MSGRRSRPTAEPLVILFISYGSSSS